jgi:hypothetical protein
MVKSGTLRTPCHEIAAQQALADAKNDDGHHQQDSAQGGERLGAITSHQILGRLHHQYCRIYFSVHTGIRKTQNAVAKHRRRTIETTWKRIGTLLDVFPPQECAN